MKYYIIAGEASGDLHGSNLVKQIMKKDSSANIRGWGGDLMESQGAEVVKHYRDLAFMGFTEVIMNLRTILKNFDICKKDIEGFEPDVLILIDYPGFNLRMAKYAHERGLKVFYYISPQVWAWKKNRVKQIKAYVDEMYVILPFEKEFFKKFDVDVHFVGHPLIDAVTSFKKEETNRAKFLRENQLSEKPIIALLPGSRKQEIKAMLPLMLKVARKMDGYQIVIAGAPSQDESFYRSMIEREETRIIFAQTYHILSHSHSAMVTSGTATLETGIFKVPQVVCYRGGLVSYLIARALVKIKYISLVNLIMDREIVKELIQGELTEKNLENELRRISEPGSYRSEMEANYIKLYEKLGGEGASERVADLMLKTLGVTSQ